MLFSLGKWRPGHLLASWGVYWAGLAAVKLGPALLSIVRVTQLPDGKGGISASFANDLLSLTVTENGATVWEAAAPLAVVSLWVAGPPLLIWLAWLMRRPRRSAPELPGLPTGDVSAPELSSAERRAAIAAGLPYGADDGARLGGARAADTVRVDRGDRR